MKTVFFDIDTQYDFIMPDGHLYVPGGEKLIPVFEKLLVLAQQKGITIISSTDAHPDDDPEFSTFPPHCVKGTKGAEKVPGTLLDNHYVIENRPDAVTDNWDEILSHPQIIIEKEIFSMFGNVNTDELLKKVDFERAVVYGVATDYCVKAAALGLKERGYEVVVVEDAIAAVTPDTCEISMKEMIDAGIEFVKFAEMIFQ